ncbi:MAG: hypothetical protein EPO68_01730 [Planctomycetota bacterium]|nr:MAG: hypothetical protein EPO68_01730 [Planctomycetota bacterium]
MRSWGVWIVIVVVLGGVALSVTWLTRVRVDSIQWTSSPTELAPGESFVAASGEIDGASRLEFEIRQWQGGPLRARVTSKSSGLLLESDSNDGKLDSGCDLPAGAFELRVENADTVARVFDVKARLAD